MENANIWIVEGGGIVLLFLVVVVGLGLVSVALNSMAGCGCNNLACTLRSCSDYFIFQRGKKNIRKFIFLFFWCRTDIFVVLCKYRVQEQEEEDEFIESCVSFIQLCSRTEKGKKHKTKSNGWAIFPCASFLASWPATRCQTAVVFSLPFRPLLIDILDSVCCVSREEWLIGAF